MGIFEITDLDDNVTETETPTTTIYSQLREEMSSPIEVDLVWLPVKGRPSVEIGYLPSIEFDVVKAFMKKCVKPGGKDFDPLKFGYQVLAFLCRGTKMKGTEVFDKEGEPITFHNMIADKTTIDTINWVYGSQGQVIGTAQKLIDLAGYNQDEIDEDSSPLDFL